MAKVKYDELGRKDESVGGGGAGTAYNPITGTYTTGANTKNASTQLPVTTSNNALNNLMNAGQLAGATKAPQAAAGVLLGGVAAANPVTKKNETTVKTGGGTGGGTPATTQATASETADWDPYASYNQVTGGGTERPANEVYSPSQQVNDAYNAMLAAQQGQPGAYTPSAAVVAAQQALESMQTNKPQGYSSKYQPQMDALLEQIQNPGQFKYEFNGDNLFKQYADLYTQQGKQASLNAAGAAAALTGGYGNSYAQQAANQTYDQYLTQLYDKGLELRDRAYEQWLNEQQNLYNQYGLLNDADNTAYGRYRDTVGDWENERNYAANRLDTERGYDYDQYRDLVSDWMNNRNYATDVYNNERNFDYGMYGDRRDMAEKQYQYDANMAENIRQFNESMNWDKMTEQQKYAAQYAMNILANGAMPSDSMLQAAGLSRADAMKLKAQLTPAGGGGGGSGNGGAKKLAAEGADGQLYEIDSKGNPVTDSKGSYVVVDPNKESNVMVLNEDWKYRGNAVGGLVAQGALMGSTNVSADTIKKQLKK